MYRFTVYIYEYGRYIESNVHVSNKIHLTKFLIGHLYLKLFNNKVKELNKINFILNNDIH